MSSRRKNHGLTMFSVWFLTVFLVLFPKGGIKLAGVPLTWGYLYLALLLIPLLGIRFLCFPLRVPMRVVAVAGISLPLQLTLLYALLCFGLQEVSWGTATLTGLVVLPVLFLFVFPPFLPYVDGERFARYFKWCILVAAVWGIFLFFTRPVIGHFIEIPLLTVNLADYGNLETTKYIQRGYFFKLISTYNNGNIYGLCTLMLLPLYNVLEGSRWRRWIVKAALFLTLSRTVWVGLVIAELMSVGGLLMRQIPIFPRLQLKGAVRSVLMVVVTFLLVCGALLFNASSSLSFLFDPTLGNRVGIFSSLSNATLLPTHGLTGFAEVTYASAVAELGYAGGIGITLLLLSPVFVLPLSQSALQTPARAAALKGLILYAVMSTADGGVNYIPVLAFYWFLYMIYLYNWPKPASATVNTIGMRHHPDLGGNLSKATC